MVTLSVLIVQYGSDEPLKRCLKSLEENTEIDHEILVQDNNPPNPNLGFPKANNILARKSHGRYIVLLNADTVVPAGWETPLIREVENARVGIVQPRLIRPDGQVDSTGHEWRSSWGVPIIGDRQRESDELELRSCCFAAAMIKREAFENIGPFDERFFIFYDDVDYCLRAKQHNWRVRYCPDTTIIHARGTAVGSTATRLGREDYYRFLWKHFRFEYLVKRTLELGLAVRPRNKQAPKTEVMETSAEAP